MSAPNSQTDAKELADKVLAYPSPVWEGFQWMQAAILLARAVQGQSGPSERPLDLHALGAASWELQRHFGREGSIYGIKACEEIARLAIIAYQRSSATSERQG